MFKLIKMSDFEKVLDEIEESIKDINKVKELLNKDEVFYLDKLNKMQFHELIKLLDNLESNFSNAKRR